MNSNSYQLLPTSRIEWVKVLIGIAFLIQILISTPLWLGLERTFPLIPVIGSTPFGTGDFMKFVLFGSLLLTTLGLIFIRNQQMSIGAFLLVMFIFFLQDITRLQAWTYQYFIMLLTVFAYSFHRNKHISLATLQLILVFTYFWSGLQKINAYFPELVFPWMMDAYPFLKPFIKLTWLGFVVAGFEAFLGIGLFFQKTRKWTVWFAMGFHLIILGLLIGLNWNEVVYPWNVAMIGMIWVLFSDRFISNSNVPFVETFRTSKKLLAKLSLGIVILLFGIMPFFNFLKIWDDYLSLKMYSGVGDEATLYFDSKDLFCVPEVVQDDIYFDEENNHMRVSTDDWAFNELKVPAYSNHKMYRKIGEKYCECLNSTEAGGIEIIGTPRWSFEENIISFDCNQLLRK